jgi:hypothetical protein
LAPKDSNIEIKRLNLAELSPEDRHSINEVLVKSPNATVFHTTEWNNLLTNEFGLQNVTLLATMVKKPVGLYNFDVDGHLCRSPTTHLESVYGGPISTCDDKVVIKLLKEGERLQRVALFRIWTPANYVVSPLVKVGYSSREMYTSILRLQRSEEELWAGLNRKKRNMIRKAIKNKVCVVEGDVSLVNEYYEMVVSTFTRARLNILPRSFYRHVIEQLGTKGMAKFLLAKHNGRFIAGVIVLPYKDMVYGWHMASHKEYWSVAPNDLLQWEIIKWARQKGYKYYDFLRVQPDSLPGIARWKITFGGDTVPCYYLQKATPGYQLWRVLRLVTSPRRVVNKLRSLAAGKEDDAN